MSCVQGAAVVDVASYSCRVTTACSELDHHKVHAPSRHHSVEVSGCALKFRRPVADAGRYVPVSAIRALALGVLVAVSAIVRSQDSVIANPELRQELLAMRAEDQRVRLEATKGNCLPLWMAHHFPGWQGRIYICIPVDSARRSGSRISAAGVSTNGATCAERRSQRLQLRVPLRSRKHATKIWYAGPLQWSK
jgi:hypothetical protein